MNSFIGTTQVDGIPVFWGGNPGPLQAQLVFRTGRMDEAFTELGWTHLIEHLAMPPLDSSRHHNGSVGLLTTSFVTQGDAEEVMGFLRGLCQRLVNLPTDRLPHEQRVLEIEAEGRAADDASLLALIKYGALGPGKVVFDEFGARVAEADDLSAFSRSRFHRGNSALILSGPPPAGLALPLGEGSTRLPPDVRSLLPHGRHGVALGLRGSALALDVPRTDVARALAAVLEHEAVRTLRDDAGISYSPSAALRRIDSTRAQLHIFADSLERDESDVTRVLVGLLEAMASDGPDSHALEFVRSRHGDAQDELALVLEQQLDEHLFPAAIQLSRHRLSEVSLEEIRDLAAACLTDALVGARSSAALPDGWPEPQAVPFGALAGRTLLETESTEHHTRLHITDEGVQVSGLSKEAHWEPYGVRWGDVAGVVAYEDGYRELIRMNASALTLVPSTWLEGTPIAQLLDEQLAGRVVHLGMRPQWLVTPQEQALSDLQSARDEVKRARAHLGVLRRGAGKSILLALGALSAALVVLGAIVWVVASVAGRVPASFVVALLGGILFAGYRASQRDSVSDQDAATSEKND